MTRPLRLLSLAATVLALASPVAAVASALIHLKACRQPVQLASPRFSPDGVHIAFVTLRPDFRLDPHDAALCAVDIQSGKLRVLVSGMRDVQVPRWSPDGRTLAFIAKAGKPKWQIYAEAAGRPASRTASRTTARLSNGVIAQPHRPALSREIRGGSAGPPPP